MNEPTRVSGARVALVLCRRELLRFARQPARVVAAIGTPLLLWLLMASGLADAIAKETLVADGEATYTAFLLPGMMTLTAVFAAIFASISIIEDRNEGWLQGALVSPAPRWAIALGRIGGGGVVAFVQAAALLLAVPFLGVDVSAGGIVLILIGVALTSIAMAATGITFAWRCETTASFHAVMNLLFMPMWLLSGAFFPAERAHPALGWLVTINPLTWATQSIRAPLLGQDWGLAMMVTIAFAAVMVGVAVWTVARGRR